MLMFCLLEPALEMADGFGVRDALEDAQESHRGDRDHDEDD
jgi:hypothetical protein